MIKYIRGVSLIDYPGRIATLVFIGGCNFRCPFCHNADLVLPERLRTVPDIPYEEALNKIKKHRGFVDGVVFTGGEPTLWKDLKNFARDLKEIGLLLKLDTNGYNPSFLEESLKENLFDYVAMDIKSSPQKYAEAVGLPTVDMGKIRASIELVKQFPDYEFRTTFVHGLTDREDWEGMAKLIKGAKLYALQPFFPRNTLSPDYLNKPATPKAFLLEAAEFFKNYVERVEVRA